MSRELLELWVDRGASCPTGGISGDELEPVITSGEAVLGCCPVERMPSGGDGCGGCTTPGATPLALTGVAPCGGGGSATELLDELCGGRLGGCAASPAVDCGFTLSTRLLLLDVEILRDGSIESL